MGAVASLDGATSLGMVLEVLRRAGVVFLEPQRRESARKWGGGGREGGKAGMTSWERVSLLNSEQYRDTERLTVLV
jgi:hypothetical protein